MRSAAEEARRALLAAEGVTVESHRLKWSEGTTTIYAAGSGHPYLLIHGGMGDSHQWIPLLPHLVAHGRIVAVDWPGHGLADPYRFQRGQVLDLATRFLDGVLEDLKLDRPVLVAHSMGGLWTLAYARARPEGVGRIVLVGTPAGFLRWVPLFIRLQRWPLVGGIVRRQMAHPTPASTRWFYRQLLVAHPDRLSEPFIRAATEGAARNARSWFSLIDATIGPCGLYPELLVNPWWGDLQAPVHFVIGERDAMGSPLLVAPFAARRPDRATLTVIPGAGHLPWFDQPALVTEAILR